MLSGGGEEAFSILLKYFCFDKAVLLYFEGQILKCLAHAILARFLLQFGIQLFLFMELSNRFSNFKIAHIFVQL